MNEIERKWPQQESTQILAHTKSMHQTLKVSPKVSITCYEPAQCKRKLDNI